MKKQNLKKSSLRLFIQLALLSTSINTLWTPPVYAVEGAEIMSGIHLTHPNPQTSAEMIQTEREIRKGLDEKIATGVSSLMIDCYKNYEAKFGKTNSKPGLELREFLNHKVEPANVYEEIDNLAALPKFRSSAQDIANLKNGMRQSQTFVDFAFENNPFLRKAKMNVLLKNFAEYLDPIALQGFLNETKANVFVPEEIDIKTINFLKDKSGAEILQEGANISIIKNKKIKARIEAPLEIFKTNFLQPFLADHKIEGDSSYFIEIIKKTFSKLDTNVVEKTAAAKAARDSRGMSYTLNDAAVEARTERNNAMTKIFEDMENLKTFFNLENPTEDQKKAFILDKRDDLSYSIIARNSKVFEYLISYNADRTSQKDKESISDFFKNIAPSLSVENFKKLVAVAKDFRQLGKHLSPATRSMMSEKNIEMTRFERANDHNDPFAPYLQFDKFTEDEKASFPDFTNLLSKVIPSITDQKIRSDVFKFFVALTHYMYQKENGASSEEDLKLITLYDGLNNPLNEYKEHNAKMASEINKAINKCININEGSTIPLTGEFRSKLQTSLLKFSGRDNSSIVIAPTTQDLIDFARSSTVKQLYTLIKEASLPTVRDNFKNSHRAYRKSLGELTEAYVDAYGDQELHTLSKESYEKLADSTNKVMKRIDPEYEDNEENSNSDRAPSGPDSKKRSSSKKKNDDNIENAEQKKEQQNVVYIADSGQEIHSEMVSILEQARQKGDITKEEEKLILDQIPSSENLQDPKTAARLLLKTIPQNTEKLKEMSDTAKEALKRVVNIAINDPSKESPTENNANATTAEHSAVGSKKIDLDIQFLNNQITVSEFVDKLNAELNASSLDEEDKKHVLNSINRHRKNNPNMPQKDKEKLNEVSEKLQTSQTNPTQVAPESRKLTKQQKRGRKKSRSNSTQRKSRSKSTQRKSRSNSTQRKSRSKKSRVG